MRIRDSINSPLAIATVAAGRGAIGITLCPGKQCASLSGGAWQRDLALDVAAIVEWGATAVATLIEPAEFAALGVERLPAAMQAAGLEWHHVPVADVQAPDARFERRWAYAGRRLRARLRAGERVLVHCRGGLGRAGAVAAALLVEFGAEPEAAIAAVRAARPGAIETRAQERWVHRQQPVTAAQDARADRELGCLLGGALGDALGYRVEFDSLATIQATYGPDGVRLAPADGRLVVSDDTQMTLFTLEGMVRAGGDEALLIPAIRHAYLDWRRTQVERLRPSEQHAGLLAHPELWRSRAPGHTCLSALAKGGAGTPVAPINDSKGCGGVMRTAPIGFLAASQDERALYAKGAEAAALTHGHPDGYAPAGVMALAVHLLLQDRDWDHVLSRALTVLPMHPAARGTQRLLAAVAQALQAGEPAREAPRHGAGWVGDEALAVGWHAAAAATSFAEAIEAAANHDGDSDSTASIAGQLYGARHGLEVLPAEAVYRLDVLDAVLAVHADWARGLGCAAERA